MISRASTKFIKSLQLKKYRKTEQLFVVEGGKSVLEVLGSTFNVKSVVATERFFASNREVLQGKEVSFVSEKELTGLGSYKTNNAALAVVHMKPNSPVGSNEGWLLGLDGVNDPGNLGTILRIADWYGINRIVASKETADFYNPKVVASSKGSFCRVNVYYTDLEAFIKSLDIPVYGAFMEGDDVHKRTFEEKGLLVLGNEANGISEEVSAIIRKKITIPRYGQAESLNVAMATAIICDNIFRGK